MIIDWEHCTHSVVLQMRLDSTGHLRDIQVHTQEPRESTRFTLTNEDPYVLTGGTINIVYYESVVFNKIDIFYYPSVTHNE